MDLTEFLLARIAEDEAWFEECVAAEVEDLRADGMPDTTADDVRTYWLRAPGNSGDPVADGTTHWRRWLAECEAKRRIVWKHTPFHVTTKNDGLNWDYRGCGECHTPEGVEEGQTWWPCATLRLLALPYVDHPDYDESWRP